ncbi:MAG TPA: PspC domain-containing protein [Anaerolineaceae bacterium]|jgi:phage shock protein C|nr:PspC domain-containing protein [Anaerolineaceae bacterium]HOV07247.1 PspC domain-containing protein [Anaerolineaceae bacterium]
MSDSTVKRLYRSRTDRKIAGVCGGLAEYFGIDPTIIRLGFVLGLILAGGTATAYLIMALVIPEEPL